ncbi:hypothetical protein BDV27DRAFT_59371 [Aspergillus caelatus]|uniref:Uncharacterized protein n=1 Tax=Aspergillus caelatus TaxID=61420 RepID=A0A5N6ZN45_9EURO|nr:uncharacterized protein BDV27DRAFT_59371 [Aspergillus caelatus]KAE8359041.1 hypothetical protein BDV27DRAFT_59371 [Aspergillus caelatus]
MLTEMASTSLPAYKENFLRVEEGKRREAEEEWVHGRGQTLQTTFIVFSKPQKKSPDRKEQPRNNTRTKFEFVLDKDQPGIRSHAMRQFWRRKQAIAKEDSSDAPSTDHTRYSRPLIPNDVVHASSQFEELKALQRQMSSLQTKYQEAKPVNSGKDSKLESSGIPAQILSEILHPLEFINSEHFYTFPVTLTKQHRKLLYYWLSTHASGMSNAFPCVTFDPIWEVWLPLNLSNSASLNAIMAHAAAHLAYLHGELDCPVALRYKTEAISTITEWLDNPEQALQIETLTSVVQLLMFEVRAPAEYDNVYLLYGSKRKASFSL